MLMAHLNELFYQSELDSYNALVRNTEVHAIEAGSISDLLVSHFPRQELIVLDAGCGPGVTMNLLLERLPDGYTMRIDALDQSETMLETYVKNLNKSNAKLESTHHSSIEDFCGAQDYDVVLAIHSLYSFAGSPKQLTTLLNNRGLGIATMQKTDTDLTAVMELSDPGEHWFEGLYSQSIKEGIDTTVTEHDYSINVTSIIKQPDSKEARDLVSWLLFQPYDSLEPATKKEAYRLITDLSRLRDGAYHLDSRAGMIVFRKQAPDDN
jgi:SAM-dependent methyltransferase